MNSDCVIHESVTVSQCHGFSTNQSHTVSRLNSKLSKIDQAVTGLIRHYLTLEGNSGTKRAFLAQNERVSVA